MHGFIRVVDRISEWSGKVLMWLPWVITAIIVWEVAGRYFFNKPTIWAHEMSLMAFGALSMVGGAYAHKYRAHVNMDLFYARFSAKGKAVMDLVTFPFFLIFCGIILWKGGEFAWRSIIPIRVAIASPPIRLTFTQSNCVPHWCCNISSLA